MAESDGNLEDVQKLKTLKELPDSSYVTHIYTQSFYACGN